MAGCDDAGSGGTPARPRRARRPDRNLALPNLLALSAIPDTVAEIDEDMNVLYLRGGLDTEAVAAEGGSVIMRKWGKPAGLVLCGVVIAGTAGCSSGGSRTMQAATTPASTTTAVTAMGASADEQFVARVSADRDIRTELGEGGYTSPDDLAALGREICSVPLSEPVDGGPARALLRAGVYLALKMKFDLADPVEERPGSLSGSVRNDFVRIAAETYCPDNPAGVFTTVSATMPPSGSASPSVIVTSGVSATGQPSQNKAMLGATLEVSSRDGNAAYTVSDLKVAAPLSSQYGVPVKGTLYSIDVSIQGESGAVRTNPLDFSARTADGTNLQAALGTVSDQLVVGDVPAGQTLRGLVAFDVPAGTSIAQIVLGGARGHQAAAWSVE